MFGSCDRYGMSFFRHRLRHVPEWEEAGGQLVLVCCRAIHGGTTGAALRCLYVHFTTEEQGNPVYRAAIYNNLVCYSVGTIPWFDKWLGVHEFRLWISVSSNHSCGHE